MHWENALYLKETLTKKSDFVFLGKYIVYTSVGDLKMG